MFASCGRTSWDGDVLEFVSMSWWLSQSVQVYLDAQLSRSQIDRLICVLKQKQTEVTANISAPNSDPCQK